VEVLVVAGGALLAAGVLAVLLLRLRRRPEDGRTPAPAPARRRAPWNRSEKLALAGTAVGAAVGIAGLVVGPDPEPPKPTPPTNPTTTTTAPPSTNVRKLLAMLPRSMRDSCTPEDVIDELAQVSCERWGATFYFELHKDALEARSSFSFSADDAKEGARGRAKTCRDADFRKPFVGIWKRPGRSHAAGQLVCTYESAAVESEGLVTWEWTLAGRPITASLLYSGDQQTAAEGAHRAWRRATT
jgi:hypothetical protein